MIAAIVAGAVFGIAVYFVNFYGFTALFPWFAMARGAISIVAHAMFGAVAGGVYQAIAKSNLWLMKGRQRNSAKINERLVLSCYRGR
jgi:aromatic ring-cleaving dioxygenase